MLRRSIGIVLIVSGCVVHSGCGEDDIQPIVTAPEQEMLAFDETAIAANGDYPSAEPLAICGADDRRFLAELTQDSPLNYKVPKRLADIKTPPSVMHVSGVLTSSSVGSGDFPFDHTFGSDFNADVMLDAPFAAAAQGRGVVGGDLHIELAAGQLPHEESAPGPATGQDWEEMSRLSRTGFQPGYIPASGDRVLVMGNWIVDCGHTNFQTEIHPITFLASAREDDGATVVHVLYNPYRETQLYHADPAKALAFDDTARLTETGAGPFPQSLIESVLRIQNLAPAPYTSIDHLESWAMLEANRTSPVSWRVCAPAGSAGRNLVIDYHLVARPGVVIEVTPDDAASCATVTSTLGSSPPAAPVPRVCVAPWDFLNEVAGEEAGDPDLDLQSEIGTFVQPQFKSRLDPAPILNCYDPLDGPAIAEPPSGQQIEVRDDVLLPFYGVIVVRRE
jgi:hypothetical protein